jgi:DNA (cytosine-5)-methyltransferase 1
MFFYILEFLKAHKPRAFFLENVRHLIKHDEGRTFTTMERILREHGYSFAYKVVKASEFGVPQHRPRVFIVGFRKEAVKNWKDFRFPKPQKLTQFMSDIFGEPCNKTIGYTLRVGGKASGLMDRRNWDTYLVNGIQRRITSVEGRKMNGFPDHFTFPVSETQAMKQLGNSVAVPAVEATAREIIKVLKHE